MKKRTPLSNKIPLGVYYYDYLINFIKLVTITLFYMVIYPLPHTGIVLKRVTIATLDFQCTLSSMVHPITMRIYG